jgi:hypothetical protein
VGTQYKRCGDESLPKPRKLYTFPHSLRLWSSATSATCANFATSPKARSREALWLCCFVMCLCKFFLLDDEVGHVL